MQTSHTPGPWSRNIPPATKYPTVWSGRNRHVAYVKTDGLPAAEVEANIKLIAAAPDLLAVVLDLQESAAYWSEYDVPIGIVDRINAAITRATGGAA